MDRRRLVRLATLLALLTVGAALPAAQAATATATMAVSVEVAPNCTVAAEPLVFGTIDAAQAQTARAAIEVSCGAEVPFTVALDDGQFSADGTRRALDPASGEYLRYDIFADAAHTQRWGMLGAQAVAGATGSAGAARLTAYGLIGGDAEIVPGSYADQVTVTTNF